MSSQVSLQSAFGILSNRITLIESHLNTINNQDSKEEFNEKFAEVEKNYEDKFTELEKKYEDKFTELEKKYNELENKLDEKKVDEQNELRKEFLQIKDVTDNLKTKYIEVFADAIQLTNNLAKQYFKQEEQTVDENE